MYIVKNPAKSRPLSAGPGLLRHAGKHLHGCNRPGYRNARLRPDLHEQPTGWRHRLQLFPRRRHGGGRHRQLPADACASEIPGNHRRHSDVAARDRQQNEPRRQPEHGRGKRAERGNAWQTITNTPTGWATFTAANATCTTSPAGWCTALSTSASCGASMRSWPLMRIPP